MTALSVLCFLLYFYMPGKSYFISLSLVLLIELKPLFSRKFSPKTFLLKAIRDDIGWSDDDGA